MTSEITPQVVHDEKKQTEKLSIDLLEISNKKLIDNMDKFFPFQNLNYAITCLIFMKIYVCNLGVYRHKM